MQTDQLNGLIALKVVAEQRNFRAAAQLLGVSASAVTQAIKQLEGRLGVALLSRTTRSTNLTEAGERFLNQAGPALDQLLSAMEGVRRYGERPFGLLRINLSRTVYLKLAPVIASFTKKYPEVTVELFFDEELTDVVAKGFDAGIRLSETMAKDMVAVKLFGPIRFVTAASPKYLKDMGRPNHPKELLAHNCIRLRIGESDYYDRWEFESKGKDFQVHVTGSLVMNDTLLLVRAALEGNGIIYFPEDAIQDQIVSGKLEVVLDPFAATSGGYYLYYPQRSQVLPKLRAFVEHIKNEQRNSRVPMSKRLT